MYFQKYSIWHLSICTYFFDAYVRHSPKMDITLPDAFST